MWNCWPERYGKFQSEIPSTSGAICEKPQGGPLPPPLAGRGLRRHSSVTRPDLVIFYQKLRRVFPIRYLKTRRRYAPRFFRYLRKTQGVAPTPLSGRGLTGRPLSNHLHSPVFPGNATDPCACPKGYVRCAGRCLISRFVDKSKRFQLSPRILPGGGASLRRSRSPPGHTAHRGGEHVRSPGRRRVRLDRLPRRSDA